MKLPFEFGVKLIFRLVLPGFVLTVGFLPLLQLVLSLNGWADKAEYAFVILVILLGWLVTVCDMPIYMFLEGRRFWPLPFRWYGTYLETSRLAELKRKINSPNSLISREAYADIRNFRLNDAGEYEVILPSRLGNLLYAFERYPRLLYGIDPVFYWTRIWLKLDKDTREEIDNMQALADSSAYTSFTLAASGLLFVVYALVKYFIVAQLRSPRELSPHVIYDLILVDHLLPRRGVALVIAGSFLFASYVVYRCSFYLHAQYGEMFKAIFDINASAIDLSAVIKELALLSAESPSVSLNPNLPRQDQFIIAARYLQYYRYRCPACNALMKPDEIVHHVCPDVVFFRNEDGTYRYYRQSDGRLAATASELTD